MWQRGFNRGIVARELSRRTGLEATPSSQEDKRTAVEGAQPSAGRRLVLVRVSLGTIGERSTGLRSAMC